MSTAVAMPYQPNFAPVRQKFLLINSSPEQVVLRWGGLQLTLPPTDAVGHRPGMYDNGKHIPGSYLIQDAYTFNADGTIPPNGSPPNWLATEAIRSLLGINPNTGEAISPFAMKGISVMAEAPTEEMVEAVKSEGRIRYEQFQWDWANETVTGYEVARDKAATAGVNARPPGQDYHRAMAILTNQKDAHPSVSQEAVDEQFLQQEADLRVLALELAEKAAKGKDIDKGALADELLQDKAVRQQLKRKYSIRARGHMNVPDSEETTPES